jgi:Domain of unknown function (DUF4347)
VSVNVWSNGPGTPGYACVDARLTKRGVSTWPWQDRAVTTEDQDYGQAGWDIGLNYKGLGDLAAHLARLKRPAWAPGPGSTIQQGEIRRLAIHAHGNAGMLHVNGQGGPSLTAKSIPSMQADLSRIGLMTANDASTPAVILLVGCVAAQGKDGSALLTELSRLWPNRRVVGFWTLGYVAGGEMKRSGEDCTEAGMRDTTALYAGEANDHAGEFWHDLKKWPWASETSPRAKVALNGAVVSGAQW